jgi:programmed cell death protein 5
VNTLQVAKPDKARQVEAMLISMAQRGQIQGQLGEEQLKSILEQVSSSKPQSTVSVSAANFYTTCIQDLRLLFRF